MDKRRIKELLADHADRLVQGQGASQPELSPEEKQELDALLNVAERVKSTLTPVTPPDTFEQELKRHLLTTAHLRQAQGYTPPNPTRDLLVVAIAIGFILSFTGVLVAMKLWRR